MLTLESETIAAVDVAPEVIDGVAEFWADALSYRIADPESSDPGQEQAMDRHLQLVDDTGRVRLVVRPREAGGTSGRIELRAFDSQDVVAAVELFTAAGAGELLDDSYPDEPGEVVMTAPGGTVAIVRSEVEAKPQ